MENISVLNFIHRVSTHLVQQFNSPRGDDYSVYTSACLYYISFFMYLVVLNFAKLTNYVPVFQRKTCMQSAFPCFNTSSPVTHQWCTFLTPWHGRSLFWQLVPLLHSSSLGYIMPWSVHQHLLTIRLSVSQHHQSLTSLLVTQEECSCIFCKLWVSPL